MVNSDRCSGAICPSIGSDCEPSSLRPAATLATFAMSTEPTTTPPLHYRRANAADAAALAALAATVWIDTYCEQGVPAAFAEYALGEFTTANFTAALAVPENVFWLAEAAAGPVGFADLRLGARTDHLSDLQQAEVARLYVLNRFTRRGIGHALLRHCHTASARDGATALWLTMYSRNAHARAFYHALGWRKIGDWAFTLAGQSYPNDVLATTIGADSP